MSSITLESVLANVPYGTCPLPGIGAAGQPAASDWTDLAAAGVRTVVDLRAPNEPRGHDEPDAVRKKLGSAVTDSGREVVRSPDKPGVTNLIDILAVARGVGPVEVEAEFEGSGYGDFKKAVAEAVVDLLAPVRARYTELRPDEAALEATLAAGAERARAVCGPIVAEVRERMGFK